MRPPGRAGFAGPLGPVNQLSGAEPGELWARRWGINPGWRALARLSRFGGGVDRFQIKIWDEDHGDTVIYDNQAGDDDLTAATDAIEGGRIVIHTSK